MFFHSIRMLNFLWKKQLIYRLLVIVCYLFKYRCSLISCPASYYHDNQPTLKTAFFFYISYHPTLSIFLLLLGTVDSERLCGNIRMTCGVHSVDALELIHSSRCVCCMRKQWEGKAKVTTGL